MHNITLCYSTHRPETLALTLRILQEHDVIVLEEPLHPDFHKALGGGVELEEHLLEVDSAYPVFTLGQYRLLQQLFKAGKEILQVEPYLDHLLSIQYFFAAEHRPDELVPDTPAHAVYRSERDATKNLIRYYQEVRGDDFPKILAAMNRFARADARRFVLRDSLRAKRILEVLVPGKDTCIEAGSIHLFLKCLLVKGLSSEWRLRIHDIDGEAVKMLNLHGSLFSPGDELTLDYIFGRSVSRKKWQLCCAQSLIYSKIITKEELSGGDDDFPHTRDEIAAIAVVKQLSVAACAALFQRIRSLSSGDAAELTAKYVQVKSV
ncbi:hypothetical protein FCL47_20725 [Desulfopila sp. IMCC35006]|nr:hypothetical protein FCL47_20725 [Desulfopila sp. IMCC35006]